MMTQPRSQSLPERVTPDVHRLTIPLPDNPLGTVNAYAVTGEDGIFLVDCGWDTPEAYEALVAQLAPLGGIARVRELVITHIHPDHFGLAGRLAQETGARVLMHRLDAGYVTARYEDSRALVQEMETWLWVNGVPPDELEVMSAASLNIMRRVGIRSPDVLLQGGEILPWDRYRFEVVWTPGHSAGLICLYDRETQLFLSSDHILQRISPHVGMHVQSIGNPLDHYLESLDRVRELPVGTVLPGHGRPFKEMAGRVDEITAHHRRRLATMQDLLVPQGQSAYEVAARLSWRGAEDGWERLAPFQRRMAVTETIAHLEHLASGGRAVKQPDQNLVLYVSGRRIAG
jgi:glyoxylase-like metal-dependent hydrolase (beta-lactamase superfamily II)